MLLLKQGFKREDLQTISVSDEATSTGVVLAQKTSTENPKLKKKSNNNTSNNSGSGSSKDPSVPYDAVWAPVSDFNCNVKDFENLSNRAKIFLYYLSAASKANYKSILGDVNLFRLSTGPTTLVSDFLNSTGMFAGVNSHPGSGSGVHTQKQPTATGGSMYSASGGPGDGTGSDAYSAFLNNTACMGQMMTQNYTDAAYSNLVGSNQMGSEMVSGPSQNFSSRISRAEPDEDVLPDSDDENENENENEGGNKGVGDVRSRYVGNSNSHIPINSLTNFSSSSSSSSAPYTASSSSMFLPMYTAGRNSPLFPQYTTVNQGNMSVIPPASSSTYDQTQGQSLGPLSADNFSSSQQLYVPSSQQTGFPSYVQPTSMGFASTTNNSFGYQTVAPSQVLPQQQSIQPHALSKSQAKAKQSTNEPKQKKQKKKQLKSSTMPPIVTNQSYYSSSLHSANNFYSNSNVPGINAIDNNMHQSIYSIPSINAQNQYQHQHQEYSAVANGGPTLSNQSPPLFDSANYLSSSPVSVSPGSSFLMFSPLAGLGSQHVNNNHVALNNNNSSTHADGNVDQTDGNGQRNRRIDGEGVPRELQF